jgi:hypothetical protein
VLTVLFDAPPHNFIGRPKSRRSWPVPRASGRRHLCRWRARRSGSPARSGTRQSPADSSSGRGFELALACDLRYMADDIKARIGLPEMTIGLPPGAGGSQRLARALGASRALELMLEGRTLTPPKRIRWASSMASLQQRRCARWRPRQRTAWRGGRPRPWPR